MRMIHKCTARARLLLSALFRRRFPSVSTTLLAGRAKIDSSWIPPKLKWYGAQPVGVSTSYHPLRCSFPAFLSLWYKVRTRCGTPHRCRSVYADACTANGRPYHGALVLCVAQLAERRSLAGELTLSCARSSANGWQVNRPLEISQLGQLSLSSFRGR